MKGWFLRAAAISKTCDAKLCSYLGYMSVLVTILLGQYFTQV